MNIMGCRLQNLEYILNGFNKTQIPLMGFDGTSLIPFCSNKILGLDDIGIYVLLPQIVRSFSITLQQAINLFFYGMIGCSFALAIVGFFLLYKNFITRLIVVGWLLFLAYFIIRYNINDVYLAYAASSLSIVPIFIYLITKKFQTNLLYYCMAFSGIMLGFLHYIRAYSGLGVIVFMVVMIVTHQLLSYKKKLLLTMLLGCGLLVPVFYFNSIMQTYKNYAQQACKDFKEFPTQHPFWHTIYLGFGFLNYSNEDNIRWDDNFGYETVTQRAPHVCLEDFSSYEEALRHETYMLWKKQPYFFVYTIFAKIGILLFFLLLFANIGVFINFFFPLLWQIELSFLTALSCYAIFPLIAVPNFFYCTGFITMAVLFGIVNVNSFLEQQNFFKHYAKKINFLRAAGLQ